MKKAAIYGMASAKDKTLESQLSELRNYAKLRGWEVHQEYLDRHIIEVGKSGPALARLMKDAKNRKFDILLVWKFDKFARSTTHLATTLEELEDLGIDFCSYEDSIDTSTNHEKLIFAVMGAIAEFERYLSKERQRVELTFLTLYPLVLGAFFILVGIRRGWSAAVAVAVTYAIARQTKARAWILGLCLLVGIVLLVLHLVLSVGPFFQGSIKYLIPTK